MAARVVEARQNLRSAGTHADSNLMGIPETRLPVDPATAVLAGGRNPQSVAAKYPSSPWPGPPWPRQRSGRPHHRGIRLRAHRLPPVAGRRARRGGWKGQGPVPWSHEPRPGFLRALAALSRAAGDDR